MQERCGDGASHMCPVSSGQVHTVFTNRVENDNALGPQSHGVGPCSGGWLTSRKSALQSTRSTPTCPALRGYPRLPIRSPPISAVAPLLPSATNSSDERLADSLPLAVGANELILDAVAPAGLLLCPLVLRPGDGLCV